MPLEPLTVNWFLCLLINTMPLEVCVRPLRYCIHRCDLTCTRLFDWGRSRCECGTACSMKASKCYSEHPLPSCTELLLLISCRLHRLCSVSCDACSIPDLPVWCDIVHLAVVAGYGYSKLNERRILRANSMEDLMVSLKSAATVTVTPDEFIEVCTLALDQSDAPHLSDH